MPGAPDEGSGAALDSGGVLSFDFEFRWGVNDTCSIAEYSQNILGVRPMVPRMLDLSDRYEFGCTRATVGFLFCDGRDELLARPPPIRPAYRNPRLSSYSYMDIVGADERNDPFHSAPSLISRSGERPCQEIANHAISHFDCLEEGHTRAALAGPAANMAEAAELADKNVITGSADTPLGIASSAWPFLSHSRGEGLQ